MSDTEIFSGSWRGRSPGQEVARGGGSAGSERRGEMSGMGRVGVREGGQSGASVRGWVEAGASEGRGEEGRGGEVSRTQRKTLTNGVATLVRGN